MKCRAWALAAILAIGIVIPLPARAADKVALLIGNAAYPGTADDPTNWRRLANAEHDVALVAAALRKSGFQVIQVKSGSYEEIRASIKLFSQLADGANLALVYFAGHGFEYQRRNYLVPVDAPPTVSDAEVGNRFIDLDRMTVEVARARVNLFLIDACRTGMQVTQSPQADSKQFGHIEDQDLPVGTQLEILYSTARDQSAFDAAPPPNDGYSPFAWEVARAIPLPHVDIGILFPTIRMAVLERTKDYAPSQAPYFYGSVNPGAYLTTSAAVDGPAGAPPATPQSLGVTDEELATVDEPLLMAKVLRDHGFAQVDALARKGDPIAMHFIGYMYEFGIGVGKDLPKARGWMEKAGATGTASGQLELAYFLRNNQASPRDLVRALSLYESAAKQGFPKALGHLAEVYMAGVLVPHTIENYNRGVELARQAADLGYPYAMYALALTAEAANPGKRIAQLRAVAQSGNLDGNQWLCDLAVRRGAYGEGLADCRASAEAGLPISQARLAIAYHDGLGVAPSPDEARHWTRLALSQEWKSGGLRETLAGYHYNFFLPSGRQH